MESSQANRLPEADSLPDGFVESSAEPPPPPPAADRDYKEPLLDVGYPVESPNDGAAEGPAEPLAPPTPEREVGSSDAPANKTESTDKGARSTQDTGECVESSSNDVKEGSLLEPNEPLQNRKPECSEAKKKATKRASKSEKELLQFTFNYQKTIAERDAAIAVREKLESLCRELQRQNKMLMEECQRVSTEGQNMRMDLSMKFNNAIKDVNNKLEQQKDESLSQLKENEMLRNKLKHLADQYSLCEQQFEAKLKQKALELQLADLKLQQQQEQSAQEHTQMQIYAEQVAQLLDTEKNLRLQLTADGEKFQQFQDALLKSNEVFETFKQEMEKMAKLIKDLKKENAFLKNKCDQSDVAIVKLIEERELMKKQLEKVKNQKERLESLCRSLQAERKQKAAEAANNSLASAEDKIEQGVANS